MSKPVKLFAPADSSREAALTGLRLASFRRRSAAFLTDLFLIGIVFLLASVWVGRWLGQLGLLDLDQDYNFTLSFGNWYSTILLVVYFAFSTYFTQGKTLGKMLFKLRIVSLEHERLSFWHCIERALGYGASALELGFGFFQVMWNTDRRATHDRIARTIVIHDVESPSEL